MESHNDGAKMAMASLTRVHVNGTVMHTNDDNNALGGVDIIMESDNDQLYLDSGNGDKPDENISFNVDGKTVEIDNNYKDLVATLKNEGNGDTIKPVVGET